MNDIFEKIIAKEIPAEIIYEDNDVIVFLDKRPTNRGHALVVPKKKFVNIFDADSEVLGHMMKVAQRIAIVLRSTMGADGVNVLMNNESAAGQEVFHAHIHVIPRIQNDGVYLPAKHTAYKEGEVEVVGQTLRDALSS